MRSEQATTADQRTNERTNEQRPLTRREARRGAMRCKGCDTVSCTRSVGERWSGVCMCARCAEVGGQYCVAGWLSGGWWTDGRPLRVAVQRTRERRTIVSASCERAAMEWWQPGCVVSASSARLCVAGGADSGRGSGGRGGTRSGAAREPLCRRAKLRMCGQYAARVSICLPLSSCRVNAM